MISRTVDNIKSPDVSAEYHCYHNAKPYSRALRKGTIYFSICYKCMNHSLTFLDLPFCSFSDKPVTPPPTLIPTQKPTQKPSKTPTLVPTYQLTACNFALITFGSISIMLRRRGTQNVWEKDATIMFHMFDNQWALVIEAASNPIFGSSPDSAGDSKLPETVKWSLKVDIECAGLLF